MVCLLVGEGDFSYALALANERDPANLVASCLFTHGHGRLDVRANVDKLSAMGVRVLMDVDARRLHEHPWVSHCAELSEIVFNFPHVGGKMKIDENRKLLRDFFISAGLVLRPGSLVRVTLCHGQGGTPAESHVRCPGDTWQVVEMAAQGGFILHQVLPFRAPAGYTPRGYRGGAKGFHIEGALTHVFCLVGSAVPMLRSTDQSIPCTEEDTMAKRLRSTMTAEETPLGRTLHCVASALGLAVGDLVASWAAQEDGCNTSGDATWSCRLERPRVCSPTKPPVGHILDVNIRDTSKMRDVLRLLRETCGNGLTFPTLSCTAGFQDVDKRLETDGCCVCCKDLHVATFAYQTLPNSPTYQTSACIGCENFTAPLNTRISFNSSVEENSCALQTQTNDSDLLSDCFSSLKLEDYKLAYSGLPCKLSLHIEVLSLAFCNLDDWRLLLPQPVSKPLFPTASFTHDLSFWLGEGFDEDDFLAFIHSKAGELLQSIGLVDDYVDARTGRRSRCYRLCYQSLWRALSREAARDFHIALGEAVGLALPVKVR